MYNKILIPVEGREGAWRAIRSSTQAVPLLAEGGEARSLRVATDGLHPFEVQRQP